jgi:hypothetical protein
MDHSRNLPGFGRVFDVCVWGGGGEGAEKGGLVLLDPGSCSTAGTCCDFGGKFLAGF